MPVDAVRLSLVNATKCYLQHRVTLQHEDRSHASHGRAGYTAGNLVKIRDTRVRTSDCVQAWSHLPPVRAVESPGDHTRISARFKQLHLTSSPPPSSRLVQQRIRKSMTMRILSWLYNRVKSPALPSPEPEAGIDHGEQTVTLILLHVLRTSI